MNKSFSLFVELEPGSFSSPEAVPLKPPSKALKRTF
jgi:hypothetical protein